MTKSTLSEFTNIGTNDQIETTRIRSAIAKPQDDQQIRSSAPSCSRLVEGCESMETRRVSFEIALFFRQVVFGFVNRTRISTTEPHSPSGRVGLSGPERALPGRYGVRPSRKREGLVYLMIQTFRFYLDKQSKLWNELNRNSYYAYIIHVAVMGLLATLMLDWETSSLLKYLILTLSTFVACNVMISFCRWLVSFVGQKTRRTELEIVR